MSGLKYLVVCLLVGTVCSYPHNQRHVRSPQLQVQQPTYSYPYQYPYQSYQPGYGLPNFPMGPSQSYPYQQNNNPWMMPSYPSYPSYGSGYQTYPTYPSYPSYPFYPSYSSYPYQQNFQADPYAHIPTEIIDVEWDGNVNGQYPSSQLPTSSMPFYPGLNWGSYPNFQVPGSPNATFLEPLDLTTIYGSATGPSNDTVRQVHTQTVESKPFTATISRIFDTNDASPTVDVRLDSKPGSGVLIEATGSDGEDTENKSEPQEEEDAADNQAAKGSDEKKTEDDEKDKPFNIFG